MNDARRLIIVIDDDAGRRRALRRLLQLSGFDTLLFDSAEAFVSAEDSRLPYCLVMDVQLPGLSGPQLYEQLGERASKINGHLVAHLLPRRNKWQNL
jgi:FixJ family two-component response regulator